MAAPEIGERIEQTLTLDPAAVKAGADLVGDRNPLHHDEAFAAKSRYGGLIASGAHTAALLAGLATQGIGPQTETGPGAVGVEYQVRFVAPVRAGQVLRLTWVVVSREPKRSGDAGSPRRQYVRCRNWHCFVEGDDGSAVFRPDQSVVRMGSFRLDDR